MVKELDCNVLCNDLSFLPPPPHEMAPGAFELEGSQLGGVCVCVWGGTYQCGVKDSRATLWTDLLPCGFP